MQQEVEVCTVHFSVSGPRRRKNCIRILYSVHAFPFFPIQSNIHPTQALLVFHFISFFSASRSFSIHKIFSELGRRILCKIWKEFAHGTSNKKREQVSRDDWNKKMEEKDSNTQLQCQPVAIIIIPNESKSAYECYGVNPHVKFL